MQEFKKNQRVVKLEPKPMKVEGKLLNLKKGIGFRTEKTRGFHSPKGTMEPTTTRTGFGSPTGEKPGMTKRNSEIMKKTEIPPPAGGLAGMAEIKAEKTSDLYWQVEEAGNKGKFPLAGKLIIFVLLLTAVVGFIMKSPIMVLTFLLFIIVFYVFMKKGKRSVNVSVDFRGIGIDNSIYSYDKLKSFWVFYDPPYEKYLSIGTKSSLSPFVRIKLGEQNPVELRNYLLSYLVEAEHPAPFLEIMMERFGL